MAWLAYARLQLAVGDRDGYRRLRTRMLDVVEKGVVLHWPAKRGASSGSSPAPPPKGSDSSASSSRRYPIPSSPLHVSSLSPWPITGPGNASRPGPPSSTS